jgi:hypothetical protein
MGGAASKIKSDGTDTSAFSGLANGLLNVVGLGDLYDPVGNLTTDLSNTKDKLQNIQNSNNILVFQKQGILNQDILKLINQNKELVQDQLDFYNLMNGNDFIEQGYFLNVSIILIFIIIFFQLIS